MKETKVKETKVKEMKVKQIRVSDINADPKNNVRRKLDGLVELMNSISHNGLLQPLRVEKRKTKGENDKGKEVEYSYTLISGFRRYAAISQIIENEGLENKKVACIVEEDLSVQKRLEFNIGENLSRNDLNPIEEAEGYQKLMLEAKIKAEKVSEMFGISIDMIRKRTALLAMSKIIQDGVFNNLITPAQAVLIDKLPQKYQEEAMGIAQGMMLKDFKEYVEKLLDAGQKELNEVEAKTTKSIDIDEDVISKETFKKELIIAARGYRVSKELVERMELEDFIRVPQATMEMVMDLLSQLPRTADDFNNFAVLLEGEPDYFDKIGVKVLDIEFKNQKAEDAYYTLMNLYDESDYDALREQLNGFIVNHGLTELSAEDIFDFGDGLETEDDYEQDNNTQERKVEVKKETKEVEDDSRLFWGGDEGKASREYDNLVKAANESENVDVSDAELWSLCVDEAEKDSGGEGGIKVTVKHIKAVKMQLGLIPETVVTKK